MPSVSLGYETRNHDPYTHCVHAFELSPGRWQIAIPEGQSIEDLPKKALFDWAEIHEVQPDILEQLPAVTLANILTYLYAGHTYDRVLDDVPKYIEWYLRAYDPPDPFMLSDHIGDLPFRDVRPEPCSYPFADLSPLHEPKLEGATLSYFNRSFLLPPEARLAQRNVVDLSGPEPKWLVKMEPLPTLADHEHQYLQKIAAVFGETVRKYIRAPLEEKQRYLFLALAEGDNNLFLGESPGQWRWQRYSSWAELAKAQPGVLEPEFQKAWIKALLRFYESRFVHFDVIEDIQKYKQEFVQGERHLRKRGYYHEGHHHVLQTYSQPDFEKLHPPRISPEGEVSLFAEDNRSYFPYALRFDPLKLTTDESSVNAQPLMELLHEDDQGPGRFDKPAMRPDPGQFELTGPDEPDFS